MAAQFIRTQFGKYVSNMKRKPLPVDEENPTVLIDGEYIPVEGSDLAKVFRVEAGVGVRFQGQTRQVARSSSVNRYSAQPNKDDFMRMVADKEGLRRKRQLGNQRVAFQEEEAVEEQANEVDWSEMERPENPEMVIRSKAFFEMVRRKGSKPGSRDRVDSNQSRSKRASSQSEVERPQMKPDSRRARVRSKEIGEERRRANLENLEAKNDLMLRMANRAGKPQAEVQTNQQNFRELRARSEDPRRPNTSQKKRVKYNLPPLTVKML
jgi:hypothetical protein